MVDQHNKGHWIPLYIDFEKAFWPIYILISSLYGVSVLYIHHLFDMHLARYKVGYTKIRQIFIMKFLSLFHRLFQIGMQQQYTLGQYLRTRYLQTGFMNTTFVHEEARAYYEIRR